MNRPFASLRTGMLRGRWFAACAIVSLVTSPVAIRAQSAIEPFPAISGGAQVVYCSTIANGKLYIGGLFSDVGYPIGQGAPFDPGTGLRQPDFPIVFRANGATVGEVRDVAPDGQGGWYVCGLFNRLGTVVRSNLAHVNADNTIDAWNPAPNGAVTDIEIIGSTVFVAGSFTTIGGQSRNGLAAIDAATGLAIASWNPFHNNTFIGSLAAGGSVLYVGGDFTSIGGQLRNHIAALDPGTGLASSWNPGSSVFVRAIITDGATVYYGGSGISSGPGGVLAADAVTGAQLWSVPATGSVETLAKVGPTVFAGGGFTTLGGQSRFKLAAVAAASGAVQAWNPSPSGGSTVVNALASSATTVYVGGDFLTIAGVSRRNMAELDAVTGVATGWNAHLNGTVSALTVTPGAVFIGGKYTMANFTPRNNAAAIDLATRTIDSWNPNVNGAVYAIAASGGVVFLGGGFSAVNGVATLRSRLASVDAITGAPTAWNPNANDLVWAVVPSPPVVYVGGVFTSLQGNTRNHIGAVDISTGAPTAWNPDANANVFQLAADDHGVYVGGDFSIIGGQIRSHVAALDATTGQATWDPHLQTSVSNPIFAITTAMDNVYVGGSFTSLGGQPRNNLAALDATTGLATPWAPNPSGLSLGLTVSGDVIYGGFGDVGGMPTDALDLNTGARMPWLPHNFAPQTISVDDDLLYVGGSFLTIGDTPQSGLAAFTKAGPVGVEPGIGEPGFALESYPNPCPGRADIRFHLGRSSVVTLEVFDLAGRRILTPVGGAALPAGPHEVNVVLPRSVSGVCWYRLSASGYVATKKLIVVR